MRNDVMAGRQMGSWDALESLAIKDRGVGGLSGGGIATIWRAGFVRAHHNQALAMRTNKGSPQRTLL
jgi:hypothetical protein